MTDSAIQKFSKQALRVGTNGGFSIQRLSQNYLMLI